MRKPHYAGFTLVEMLIVIAILAILTALLFPVFAQARKQSKQDVCLSNLRQLGQAAAMYASDYDEHIPLAPSPSTQQLCQRDGLYFGDARDELAKSLPDVRAALRPYKVVSDLFRCPLDRVFHPNPFEKTTWFAEFGSSYEYDDAHGLATWSLDSYPVPANNLLFWDEEYFHGGASGQDGMLGAVFVDLHAKTITWQQRTIALDANP